MFECLKRANEEGRQAYYEGYEITDCPYDSFNRETEECAMEWINGYREAEFYVIE